MFYCLERFISKYGIAPPFLDVGCGRGDLSIYLAGKGWEGKAIDISPLAVEKAKERLGAFQSVTVERESIFEEKGIYSTVLLLDVIEHIEDDGEFLGGVSRVLKKGGYVVISTPGNPKEWRWDDEYYGHYRRYTVDGLKKKLEAKGLSVVDIIDCTYPVFWLMRRGYTFLKRPPEEDFSDRRALSSMSSIRDAWEAPFVSGFLNSRFLNPFWKAVYWMQFRYFRKNTEKGWEFFALARKD